MIKIKFKRLKENAKIPEYKTEYSSGMDIYACENKIVKRGDITVVTTGIAVELPQQYEIQIRPRSGLALKHGIGVLNSPGTIDADYRGEIKVILFNFSSEDYEIKRGDRIAQMVLSRIYKAELVESDELSDTERGEGGFGHTGY